MDFVAVVDQVIALLRQRGRLTYSTLKRPFRPLTFGQWLAQVLLRLHGRPRQHRVHILSGRGRILVPFRPRPIVHRNIIISV